MLRLFVVALQMLHALGSGEVFEWAGIFKTPEDYYMWTAQKVNNGTVTKYADETMKFAALPASDATEAALDALESAGETALGGTCTNVAVGGTITPAANTCFLMTFNQNLWQSLYTINAAGVSNIAFFAQHVPTEFENTAHYLKDDHGDDIEPEAELPKVTPTAAIVTPEPAAPWGAAMGAAILVNLVTLVGVIFLVPVFAKAAKDYAAQFEGLMSGFAAGALMACAFFLLLYEATHLIAVGYKEEVEQIWRWGIMILAGFLLPGLVDLVLEAIPWAKIQEPGVAEVEGNDQKAPPFSARARLIGGVLIGDFFHNLCDGFFVGAAFKGCGNSFGWTVAGSTIAHEIAQEFADYFILTGDVAKLHPAVALTLNFLSGLSVLVGVIFILDGDIPDEQIGLLLAWGGGVYLHIAATECMPKIYSPNLSIQVRGLSFFMFIVGAIAIGLVLLDHEHCVPPLPPGAAPPPTGHGHH